MSGTLLVTGGAGFIGSHVVSAALARGWRVRVIDSLRADVHPAAPGNLSRDGVEFIQADLADPFALAAAVRESRSSATRQRRSASASTSPTRPTTCAATTSPPPDCWPQ